MLELLILLSSDISYRDTFDMMHRYSWSLYRRISRRLTDYQITSNLEAILLICLIVLYSAIVMYMHMRQHGV